MHLRCLSQNRAPRPDFRPNPRPSWTSCPTYFWADQPEGKSYWKMINWSELKQEICMILRREELWNSLLKRIKIIEKLRKKKIRNLRQVKCTALPSFIHWEFLHVTLTVRKERELPSSLAFLHYLQKIRLVRPWMKESITDKLRIKRESFSIKFGIF